MTSENSKVEIAGAGGVSLMASAGDVELISEDNVRIQSSGGSVSFLGLFIFYFLQNLFDSENNALLSNLSFTV